MDVTESGLFQGYRGTYRVEICACGGSIAARDGEEEDIRLAVQDHNDGLQHQAWREERCAEWAPIRPSRERPTALVDVSQRASAAAKRGELALVTVRRTG